VITTDGIAVFEALLLAGTLPVTAGAVVSYATLTITILLNFRASVTLIPMALSPGVRVTVACQVVVSSSATTVFPLIWIPVAAGLVPLSVNCELIITVGGVTTVGGSSA